MRIGIICPNFPPASFEGGIAHYSKVLAEELSKRNHKLIAIASTEYAIFHEKSEINSGIQTIWLKGPWNANSVSKIQRLSKKYKLDCVILQYSPSMFKRSFRLRWAFSFFPCQKITAFHTLWGKDIDRIFGLSCLFGSQKIIATNTEIMSILRKRLPFLLKKTYWIPIGSNIIPCCYKANTKQEKIPIISYFGMLYPGKGLDLILDVLVKLKQMGREFNFKFIGGGLKNYEFYETEFQNKINDKNLRDCVEYLGHIDQKEVSMWLNMSRFVFLPYNRGLSDRRGTFMAAISHKKAVLTSPPIVKMSVIKNGSNVIWPEQPSLEEYIKLTEKLLNDDKLIQRLEKGAAILSSNFNWRKIADSYESALIC